VPLAQGLAKGGFRIVRFAAFGLCASAVRVLAPVVVSGFLPGL